MTDQTTIDPTLAGSAGGHRSRERARKRRRNQLIALAVIVIGVASYFWFRSDNAAPAFQPLIAKVKVGDIENSVVAAGTLQPKLTVDIGAQVSGLLQTLHAKAGDVVKKDQLLAEIDARVQQQTVAASRAGLKGLHAQVKAREAALELARSNADRQKELMAARATSQQEYDAAMNQLASAQASLVQLKQQIQQSEASLKVDETQLEYTNIYAPMDGTIVAVKMTEGTTLNSRQTAPVIMQIADLSTMTVKANVSEADVGKLKSGMEVYFTTLASGDRRWYSKLAQILPTPTVENNVVTYTAEFDIDNADRSLFSGMTTQVYFVTSSARDVITVPIGAITYVKASAPGDAGRGAFRVASRDMPSRRAGSTYAGGSSATGGADESGESPPSAGAGPDYAANGSKAQGTDLAGKPGEAAQAPKGRRATVQVVQDDGSIVKREILVGLTDQVSAQVLSGLSPGDQVVVGSLRPQAMTDQGNQRRGGFGGFRF